MDAWIIEFFKRLKSVVVKILVTGANGFVGFPLVQSLAENKSFLPVAGLRANSLSLLDHIEVVQIGDIGANVDRCESLTGVNVVVHTAARAHIMNETSTDPFVEYRRVNVSGTLNLARQAVIAGVKRFIFISSVKVNGEATQPRTPFTENDKSAPQDPYAISKYEAEQALLELAQETEMEVVIIRPPLVYGPGVKANFQRMMRWVDKGIPLPLGAIHNQRSLVALDNLVDFVITCIDHPAAANQTFLISDGEDLSTTDLLCRVGQAMGKPARLIPIPVVMLKIGATLLGKQALAQRLCENLQVDISKAQEVLGWEPPVSVDEGLRRAVGKSR